MALSKSRLVVAFALATAAAIAAVSGQNSAQDFVDLHNEARAEVGVDPVSWDPVVAEYAQDYAANRSRDCLLVLSDGPYGENLYWGSAGRSWNAANAVELWVAQKANNHYENNSCDHGKRCGAYTQVVWRNTTSIGCARVVCAARLGTFIICSYDPPGNYEGESPYSVASLP